MLHDMVLKIFDKRHSALKAIVLNLDKSKASKQSLLMLTNVVSNSTNKSSKAVLNSADCSIFIHDVFT